MIMDEKSVSQPHQASARAISASATMGFFCSLAMAEMAVAETGKTPDFALSKSKDVILTHS